MPRRQELEHIFYPKSIVLAGAFSNPESVAHVVFLRPLLEFGYPGSIYLVNPNIGEIMGLKAYPTIMDVPEPVDYVICALPAPLMPRFMQDCVAARVKAVTVFTAGFSETGEEEGSRIEREVVRIARQGGVRVIGPNCLGIHSPKAGVSLDGSIPRESGHVRAFYLKVGGMPTKWSSLQRSVRYISANSSAMETRLTSMRRISWNTSLSTRIPGSSVPMSRV